MSEYYISHHGIKGQKWGVRRYQNRDGSYTSAGRRRRAVEFSDDYKAAHTHKDPRSMTNEELRRTNERLNLERNYKLNKMPIQKQSSKPTYTEGQKFVQKSIQSVGSAAVGALVTSYVTTRGKTYSNALNETVKSSPARAIAVGAAIGVGVGLAAHYAYTPKGNKNGGRKR